MKESMRLLPQRQFYNKLNQSITRARREVNMDFYIFEKDATTAPLFASIEQKAREGVHFQIHVDHYISLKLLTAIRTALAFHHLKKLGQEGLPIEVKRSHHQFGESKNPLRRSHKKTAIIDAGSDEAHAYFGGSNIGGRFLHWRDSMVEAGPDMTGVLHEDFRTTWNRQNSGHRRHVVNDETEILTDSKKSDRIQQRIIDEVGKAKQTIWLETSYMDNGRVRQALIDAKKKNPDLDIRVVVPHPSTSNDPRYKIFPGHWLNPMSDAGIDIYLFGERQKQFFHDKTLLIDNIAITGSSNFSDSIFSGCDAELVMFTTNEDFRQQTREWLISGMQQSEKYQRRKTRRNKTN